MSDLEVRTGYKHIQNAIAWIYEARTALVEDSSKTEKSND